MRFLFYGTLMAGSGNAVSARIHACLLPLGPATLYGRLFAIPSPQGWYPALEAGRGRGMVHGHAYAPGPGWSDADFHFLDAYEGYDPARPEASDYVRRPLAASIAGRARRADAYVYRPALPDGARPIPHGDWNGWLAETGLPPYTADAAEIADLLARSGRT